MVSFFSQGIPCKPWKMFKRIEKYWLREARWGQADSLGSVFKAYRALFRLIYPRAQLLKNSLLSFYGSISWKLLVLPSPKASNLNIKDTISLLKRDKEVSVQWGSAN